MLVCIPFRLECVREGGKVRESSHRSNFFRGGTSIGSMKLGRDTTMVVYHYGLGG